MKSKKPKTPTLELVFLNGANGRDLQPPPVKDIKLSPESVDLCNEVIEKIALLPKKIKNDGEFKLYMATLVEAQTVLKDLNVLREEKRSPWRRIVSLIGSAVDSGSTNLEKEASRIKREMEIYQETIRKGAQIEKERLEKEAFEKEQVAKYSDDSEKKRLAKNQAILIRQEAQKIAPRPVAGVALTSYWEPHLEDPLVLYKAHPDFITWDIKESVIQSHIKMLQSQGATIKPHTIPGVLLIQKSKMSYRGPS